MIRFTIYCRHAGTTHEPWPEPYTKECTDPEQWARETIEQFNATLRPGERPRELVRVEIHATGVNPIEHTWRKQNLITLSRGDLSYDLVKCERCGITGKRYGVGAGSIKRDSAFRSRVYLRCDTALAHFKKKATSK